MKSNAEKSLDLIIQVEKLNQEYKALSSEIDNRSLDCQLSRDEGVDGFYSEPCLKDWLDRKFEIDFNNCPMTGREYEVKIPYWTAPQMTEDDCPHCYAALKLIEERKKLRQKRGRVKALITKLAKLEISKGGEK